MKTEQKDTVDSKTAQEIRAFSKKYSEAYNKHDAAALAALFTEDVAFVTPEGMVLGRQAMEKQHADVFEQWHPTNHISTVDQVNAIGSDVWKVGEWSCILQSPVGPLPIKGYFASICVRQGDDWKECMLAYNMTPPAETK
jgi:uncharacterized protein (TIGR02246 family)